MTWQDLEIGDIVYISFIINKPMLKSNFENIDVDEATVISIKNVADGVEIIMKHSRKGAVKTIIIFTFEEYFTKNSDIPTPDPSDEDIDDLNYQLFLGMTKDILIDTISKYISELLKNKVI